MYGKKTFLVLILVASLYNYVLVSHPIKTKIDTLYEGISGFGITADEEGAIIKKGGAPTYGEITFESLKTIIDDLKLGSDSVIYDLGSGVGKVTIQFFLSCSAKKCIGVELSPTRHSLAVQVQQKLKKPILPLKKKNVPKRKKLRKRTLAFYNQDILDVDISDATVVFMCSTCFSEDLMKKITDKLAGVNKELHVITLKQLPENTHFMLIKTYTLPMTWSQATPVHLYKLKK